MKICPQGFDDVQVKGGDIVLSNKYSSPRYASAGVGGGGVPTLSKSVLAGIGEITVGVGTENSVLDGTVQAAIGRRIVSNMALRNNI